MGTYALTYLTFDPGKPPAALQRLPEGLAKAGLQGRLLGAFSAEIGQLNRVLLIHGQADAAALAADQVAIARSGDPFGVGDLLAGMTSDLFTTFPGTPELEPGSFGPMFEIRSYTLRAGQLDPMVESWIKALPVRQERSKLLGVLHAVAGTLPRFVHIWPYRDLVHRAETRAKAVADGIWPPPGGSPRLLTMQSEIYIPAPFSPIQ